MMRRAMRRPMLAITLLATVLLAAALPPGPARADRSDSMAGFGAIPTDGGGIYVTLCQGCHMADGHGAAGAGHYPSLAGDTRLADPGYPVYVVLNGHHGMPWFADRLSDTQVAAVVSYVRSHFGNDFTGPVTPDDVSSQRPPPEATRTDID